MPEHETPEMLRCSLESLILQAKAISTSPVAEFLSQALNPPSRDRVELAVAELVVMGAITSNTASERLTALGWHMAALPVEPMQAKMIILGVIFQAVEPALTIAACLSVPDMFRGLPNDRGVVAAIREKLGKNSDILALVDAFEQFDMMLSRHGAQSAREVAERYMLIETNLYMALSIRDQLRDVLVTRELIGHTSFEEMNRNSSSSAIRRALVLSASSHLAHRVGTSAELLTRSGANAFVHPSSVVYTQTGISGRAAWYAYLELAQTRKLFVRSNTVASPVEIMLFCGTFMQESDISGWLLDAWIACKASNMDVDLLVGARKGLTIGMRELAERPTEGVSAAFAQLAAVVRLILEQNERGEIVESSGVQSENGESSENDDQSSPPLPLS